MTSFPRHAGLVPCFVLATLTTAAGAQQVFDVSVNTESLLGQHGALDFNFDRGPQPAQLATLAIGNFSTNGSFAGGCPCSIGAVTGQAPSTVTFQNLSGLNDYFEAFTFGSQLKFTLTLDGPAVQSPNGSASGSTLAFSLFTDPSGATPALTADANGFAFLLDLNGDASTTLENFSPQTTVSPAQVSVPTVSEPNLYLLMLTGLAITGAAARRRPDGRAPRLP